MSTIVFQPIMGGEWYEIMFRYDPDLVTLIKSTIPANFRKWDQSGKRWSASKMWAQAFADAARALGHTTSGIPDPGPQTTTPPSGGGFWSTSSQSPPPGSGNPFSPGSSGGTGFFNVGRGTRQPPPKPPPMPPKPPPALTENWAKELMRRVDPDLREKVYKQLAKVLHEDLGGDGRLMQELNDARNGLAS